MIYLLTNTGRRYAAMRLLARYINEQTYQGDVTWVIVDDCDPHTPKPKSKYNVKVIRPDWRWSGTNTQARSILAGLDAIPTDAIVLIFEDDDCYKPDYIKTMVQALNDCDLVGESAARYYNVATSRYKLMQTPIHSSLASTAMRGTDALRAGCEGHNKFIDMALWRDFKGRKTLLDTQNVIGIKGMPGRGGIGVGHRSTFGDQDDGTVMNEWLGKYAETYRQFKL